MLLGRGCLGAVTRHAAVVIESLDIEPEVLEAEVLE
jgi:hypothetical protein